MVYGLKDFTKALVKGMAPLKESYFFLFSFVFHSLLLLFFYHSESEVLLSWAKPNASHRPYVTTHLDLKKRKETQTLPLDSIKKTKGALFHPSPKAKSLSPRHVVDFSEGFKKDKAPKELRAFFISLVKEVNRKKYYPRLSQRLKESGVVYVQFEVSSKGHIKNAKLKKPCLYNRLNASALKVVSSLEIKTPLPENYGRIEVTFPMDYVL